MEDGRVLLDYGVRDSTTIHCISRRGKNCLISSPVKEATLGSPERARPESALMWNLESGVDENQSCVLGDDESTSAS